MSQKADSHFSSHRSQSILRSKDTYLIYSFLRRWVWPLSPIPMSLSISHRHRCIVYFYQVFDPTFELHDLWVSDPCAITTRWTMTMALTLAKPWLCPVITFTGLSTYVFNPESSKICRHIDTWDSIDNQEFFSFEVGHVEEAMHATLKLYCLRNNCSASQGLVDFLRQLISPRPPSAGNYTLLLRARDYEIRQYNHIASEVCKLLPEILHNEPHSHSVPPFFETNKVFSDL